MCECMASVEASSYFSANNVMSDIDQAGLLKSTWRADINSEISHTGKGRNKSHTYSLLNIILAYHIVLKAFI